jgi:hypothetical protein
MSSVAIAFLFAIGVSGWAYSKMERRVGAVNMKSILTTVAAAFIITFVIIFTLLKYGFGF